MTMKGIPRRTLRNVHEWFLSGISAVQPDRLIQDNVKTIGNKLIINDQSYPLQDTYLVGFGKAVHKMAISLEKVLHTKDNNWLKKCVLSIPKGSKMGTPPVNWTVHEGAVNNLPDEESLNAARDILKFTSSLNQSDFLIILISGGGSALLPLPVSPMTLDEKRSLIKKLSTSGASIEELNTVRKAISSVKGGRLGQQIKCQIVTLIISDVIGDNLTMIASGPTVPNLNPPEDAIKCLEKYNIPINNTLEEVLKYQNECPPMQFNHIDNYLVGTNVVSLQSIQKHVENSEMDILPIILTSQLSGVASDIGRYLAQFSLQVLDALSDKKCLSDIDVLGKYLHIPEEALDKLKDAIITKECHGICLLLGGETTVVVKGQGKGGRNQELVLACSIELDNATNQARKPNGDIVILSGGTDGIDGPNDAAGAIAWYSKSINEEPITSVKEGRLQNLDPDKFLGDNNSYEYFSELTEGLYHIKTGHTGTNVMDVQIICIQMNS